MDNNTLEFLRGLCDLMHKHNMTIGCDIDEGGGTSGIHIESEVQAPHNVYHVLVDFNSYLHAVDVAEFILDNKGE